MEVVEDINFLLTQNSYLSVYNLITDYIFFDFTIQHGFVLRENVYKILT